MYSSAASRGPPRSRAVSTKWGFERGRKASQNWLSLCTYTVRFMQEQLTATRAISFVVRSRSMTSVLLKKLVGKAERSSPNLTIDSRCYLKQPVNLLKMTSSLRFS